jgi:hypothetical protein
MERTNARAPYPALLPIGTVVGRWRVVAWQGGGVHGAVYRAVRVGQEDSAPVALKVALLPRDPRFAREVALLSRVHHPSIPRLLDQGEWQHPGGTRHPYLVMELIEGAPLYEQARQHPASSQQVLRWLAQLAGALQAVHAQEAVHRDVKGGNVLVRHEDGRAVLIDFGSGTHAGADTLTQQTLPPGTPAYRSPEAWMFELRHWRDPQARYHSGPADDLYALGVMGYQLVTGKYPELAEPRQDEAGTWHLEEMAAPPPDALNPRVDFHLSALIYRMLSLDPEARGTVQGMAEALERAAERRAPGMGAPLFDEEMQPSSAGPHEEAAASAGPGVATVQARAGEPDSEAPPRVQAAVERFRPWAHERLRWPLLVAAVAGLALIVWGGWTISERFVERPGAEEVAGVGMREEGNTALGEAAAVASTEASSESSRREAVGEESLPEPLPGQVRPDAKGYCLHKQQVALNGGCWVTISVERERCEQFGYMFKGKCYAPARPRGRQPTSSPEGPR